VPQTFRLPKPSGRSTSFRNESADFPHDRLHTHTVEAENDSDTSNDDERASLTRRSSENKSALLSRAERSEEPITVVVKDDLSVEPSSLVEPDSQFFNVDGLDVHYKFKRKAVPSDREENTAGMNVVFMHGFVAGSVHSWYRCFYSLYQSPEVDTVLSFDRPGFGLTTRLLPVKNDDYGTYTSRKNGREKTGKQDNPYTPEYSIYLLFRLLDHLGLDNVLIVGHSSGGALALRASLEQPSRMLGLCLISPTVYSQGFPEFVKSIFRTRLGKAVVQQLVRSEIGEVAIRRAWHNVKKIPDDVINNYKNTLRAKNWHEALVEMASTLDASEVAKQLHEVQVPILILHGNEDKIVPVSESEQMLSDLARFGNAEVAMSVIRECGHVPHEEASATVVSHLLQFFIDLKEKNSLLLHSQNNASFRIGKSDIGNESFDGDLGNRGCHRSEAGAKEQSAEMEHSRRSDSNEPLLEH